MLDFCGIEQERLRARWVSSAEAPEFVEEVNSFIDTLKKLGPSPLKADTHGAQTQKTAIAAGE
jgi:F420-non-reducing hydrogenase iron-sulfur subunit